MEWINGEGSYLVTGSNLANTYTGQVCQSRTWLFYRDLSLLCDLQVTIYYVNKIYLICILDSGEGYSHPSIKNKEDLATM